jgi:hypothetical protein
MRPLTDKQLRASFINASLRERNSITLPADFSTLDWDTLDFFGWRDPKIAPVGYVVVELDVEPVGVMLRQADGKVRARPQCAWCEDVELPNDVLFFVAKRAGQAGRNGNTVGTLVCAHFECGVNVRRRPASATAGFDPEETKRRRIDTLREHARAFVLNVRDGG